MYPSGDLLMSSPTSSIYLPQSHCTTEDTWECCIKKPLPSSSPSCPSTCPVLPTAARDSPSSSAALYSPRIYLHPHVMRNTALLLFIYLYVLYLLFSPRSGFPLTPRTEYSLTIAHLFSLLAFLLTSDQIEKENKVVAFHKVVSGPTSIFRSRFICRGWFQEYARDP